jgi:putative nucleotidyltransferase with HDIG domain
MKESAGAAERSPLSEDAFRAAVPPDVVALGRTLAGAGHGAWLVGGCLRDLLLGRAPRDWDIATSAGEAALHALFPRVRRPGDRGATLLAAAGPGSPLRQVTLLEGRTIDADLARRDFTMNALAAPLPALAPVLDPFGGAADLRARILRAVVDPAARFTEDPLRVLRAARFESELGVVPEPRTRAAMARLGPAAAEAAPERAREEILRLLEGARASAGIERMRETGMLAALLPEIAATVGIEQNRHHRLDVYAHTLAALDFAAEDRGADPVLRFAVLYHDAGKPGTRSVRNGEASFLGHERSGARLAERRARALRFAEADVARARHLVLHHLVRYTAHWSDRAVRRFIRRVGVDAIDDVLRLYAADSRAKDPERFRGIGEPPEVAALRARIEAVSREGVATGVGDLAVSGEDVMRALDLAPGPDVGAALAWLLEQVTRDPTLNRRDRLIEALRAREPSGTKTC